MKTKDVNHQTHLDGTIKMLTGDLVEEATKAGLDNQFQRWIEDLKDANNPALHDLIVDMQALKAHFGSGTIDVNFIIPIITRLGENTAQTAHFAENVNTATRITKLAEVLTGVAHQLRHGGPAPDGKLPQDYSSHR
jgi:hypothetical protein